MGQTTYEIATIIDGVTHFLSDNETFVSDRSVSLSLGKNGVIKAINSLSQGQYILRQRYIVYISKTNRQVRMFTM